MLPVRRALLLAAAAVALLLPPSDAEARRHRGRAHCARGEIYRVSKGVCEARPRRGHRRFVRKASRRPVQAEEPEPLVSIDQAQECRPAPSAPPEYAPWLWPGRWVHNAGLEHPGKWSLQ